MYAPRDIERNTAVQGQKLELTTKVLRSRGMVRLKAFGTSMLPTIWPGDALVIKGMPSDRFASGDVVLVDTGQGIRVHRLVQKDGSHWITRGDAMPQNDPAVRCEDVLGKVLEIHRHEQTIAPDSSLPVLRRFLAAVLCRSRICRRVAQRAYLAWRTHRLHEDITHGQSHTMASRS